MPKQLSSAKLTLKTPCHENWSSMTPTAKGRFCAACAREVVDVTARTDNEILRLLGEYSQTPCLRMRSSQLNRRIVYTHTRPSGTALTRLLASAMALCTSSAVIAQQIPAQKASISQESVVFSTLTSLAETPCSLWGQVKDRKTKQPIDEITISIDSNYFELVTDEEGFFELPLSPEMLRQEVAIQIYAPGYILYKKNIPNPSRVDSYLTLFLRQDPHYHEITVMGDPLNSGDFE